MKVTKAMSMDRKSVYRVTVKIDSSSLYICAVTLQETEDMKYESLPLYM